MKKLFTQCILLLAAISMVSCSNPNGRATAKRTVIDGKVTNLQAFPDSKEFTLEVMDFGGNPTTYKGIVHKDGSFKIYFDQYIAQDVKLTPIVRTFIAHPGDSIHIDIDYKSMGDVVFSGDGEKTNTDINHYTEEYYSTYDNAKERLYFGALDTASFRAVCENTQVEMLKKRSEFIDKYQPNDEVKMWTKNYINLHYYTSLLYFNTFYNGIKMRKTPGFVPEVLKGYTISNDDINEIFNTNLLNAESYRLILWLAHTNPKAEVAKQFRKNALTKQLLTGYVFFSQLTVNNAEYFDKFRKKFNTEIQAGFIKQPLLKYYAEVKKNLANPKTASEAILNNASGTTGKSILDSIKNQNKGKVIYVDFWATWCGPCKAELPFSEKLIQKYKGKDVAFVFVCLDSPKDTWKLTLADIKLEGNQYYCDRKQGMGILKGFKITGIPYYMMINKHGDITENGNGLRPRDPLTVHKIDKLLN